MLSSKNIPFSEGSPCVGKQTGRHSLVNQSTDCSGGSISLSVGWENDPERRRQTV